MTSTRRKFLGVAGSTVALAGCLGGEGSDSGPVVDVRSHEEHGDVLVGQDDMALYMYDRDSQGEGESACDADCAEGWPPLTVDGSPSKGDDVTAELSTFERADGATQVAAGGWPLYYFSSDEEPSHTRGQGASDVWWLLRPDGSKVE